MKKSRGLIILWLVVAWVVDPVFAQSPPNEDIPPQPESLDGAVTHVFKSTPQGSLRLHVFSSGGPVAGESRPAIVLFFGGGFVRGSVEQFVPQARHLADRGAVAIVADYRVSGRHGTGRVDAFADGQSAIRWVRLHAHELGIDPDRIAAGGGSSGGGVALAAGVLDAFDDPADYDGVDYKPNALLLFNPSGVNRLPQGSAAALSPANNLTSGLAPAVIYHGVEDTGIPIQWARSFCDEYDRLGNTCRLVEYQGAEHGFFNPDVSDGRFYRETLLDLDRFLTELGYLPAPPATDVDWPVF